MRGGWVYIVASRRNGTIFVGVTSGLGRRMWEHREGLIDGFSKRYGCKALVYAEWHDGIEGAIEREKRVKEWRRSWKLRLIEKNNPNWDDLARTILS